MNISFFVPGIPAPGGSKNVFPRKGGGGYVVVDAGKGNAQWKRSVATVAKKYMAENKRKPFEKGKALYLYLDFYVKRPQSHFTSKGVLKKNAPSYPTSKPDECKLRRSTEDALTGICWYDDAQVVRCISEKNYCLFRTETSTYTNPGVSVLIVEM
mgnify:CR=1 FL=1